MNLAEQAAAIMGRCTHYNMITGEGFVAKRYPSHHRGVHPYVLAQGPEGTLIMRKLDDHGRVIRQRVGYPDGSSLLYSCEYGMSPVITTNDRKPDDDS